MSFNSHIVSTSFLLTMHQEYGGTFVVIGFIMFPLRGGESDDRLLVGVGDITRHADQGVGTESSGERGDYCDRGSR